jgi:hypothetical protein
MSATKLICSIVGLLLSVAGTVIHEAGAARFASDLRWLPRHDLLLEHPLAAIAVGVVVFVFGVMIAPDPIVRR